MVMYIQLHLITMETLLASGSRDNTIKLWNLETKTEIATLEGHND